MKTLILLSFLSVALFCSSCKRTCSQTDVNVYFSAFDSTELSRVIVKKYAKGSGFVAAISEEEHPQDSMTNAVGDHSNRIFLSVAYDWSVELPLANRTYRIRDMHYKNTDDGDGMNVGERAACSDGIDYIIDDVPMEEVTSWDTESPNAIELKK